MNTKPENEISVRQWLEKFRACLQNPTDFAAQFESDWYDILWNGNDEMRRRISPFAKLVEAITDPYILDHYYIWFMEHGMPFSGKPYDDVRFDLLSGERNKQYFLVRLDCAGWKKWSLFSERYGFFAPEFECGNVRGMAEYIDGMPRLCRRYMPEGVNIGTWNVNSLEIRAARATAPKSRKIKKDRGDAR